jgi:hypothetical protein
MFLATCKFRITPTSLLQDFDGWSPILVNGGYDDQELRDLFKQEYEADRLLAYNVSLFDQGKTIEFTFIWETEQMHIDFENNYLINNVYPIMDGHGIGHEWETQEI